MVWTFDYAIRQFSELQFLLPSDSSSGKPAVASPVSYDAVTTGFLFVFVAHFFWWLIISMLNSLLQALEGTPLEVGCFWCLEYFLSVLQRM